MSSPVRLKLRGRRSEVKRHDLGDSDPAARRTHRAGHRASRGACDPRPGGALARARSEAAWKRRSRWSPPLAPRTGSCSACASSAPVRRRPRLAARDQVAAVAVSFLLYRSSGSPLVAALGYATAYLPWFVGGPLLAAWAERLPPRTVMISCDLVRAALIGHAAVPGVPPLVVAGSSCSRPCSRPRSTPSRARSTSTRFPGEVYPLGVSVRNGVHQVAQLVGFAFGGALRRTARHPRRARRRRRVVSSSSAVLIREGCGPAPPVADGAVPVRRPAARHRRRVPGRREPTRAAAPLWCCRCSSQPVVIVPLGHRHRLRRRPRRGARAVGAIMASTAGGAALGAFGLGRLVRPTRHPRLLGPHAVASGVR